MTSRKPVSAPAIAAAVAEAKKRTALPAPPVIQHTKLLRAELQAQLELVNSSIASIDRDLAYAAGVRDEEQSEANRVRDMTVRMAEEKFAVIRNELDPVRADSIKAAEIIEAAIAGLKGEQSNVVPMVA